MPIAHALILFVIAEVIMGSLKFVSRLHADSKIYPGWKEDKKSWRMLAYAWAFYIGIVIAGVLLVSGLPYWNPQ